MDDAPLREIASALGRISKILAGLLMRDIEGLDQGTKILRLRACGFGNIEIAEMLNTTPLTVKVTVSQLKAKKRGALKRKAKAKSA